ncbi:MAG: outer membrane lipoprotein-sorting protein [Candidatus Omnitrophica bacterium]|nr:outer membrane lipoprotein-sorting protein [Candidatus Omnitrophota bacterium]
MKKKLICLAVLLFAGICFAAQAADLNFHQVYKIRPGMSVDEIIKVTEHVQYTLNAFDYQSTGNVLFIDESGATRTRKFLRQRIVLGPDSLNPEYKYKDLVIFTQPTLVKGLGILTWSYSDPDRDQDQWLWLPSLKKVRKISAAQADDSFMGSDFTVEEITTRTFDDETYKLLGEEKFKGYPSEIDNKTYYEGRDCYKIECRPKRQPWYYSKRITWIDKEYGSTICDEVYDPKGRLYKTILKRYKLMKVDGKDYYPQIFLEAKDLRTGHKTGIVMEDIKFDQGLPESHFSVKTLMRSRW